jgi:hypothetical protein
MKAGATVYIEKSKLKSGAECLLAVVRKTLDRVAPPEVREPDSVRTTEIERSHFPFYSPVFEGQRFDRDSFINPWITESRPLMSLETKSISSSSLPCRSVGATAFSR